MKRGGERSERRIKIRQSAIESHIAIRRSSIDDESETHPERNPSSALDRHKSSSVEYNRYNLS